MCGLFFFFMAGSGNHGCDICSDFLSEILRIYFLSLIHPLWPLQDGFVLCCLSLKAGFPEPDLFPTTHMIGSFCSEETSTWDKLVGKKCKGMSQWLIAKLDNMVPYDIMFTKSYKTFLS